MTQTLVEYETLHCNDFKLGLENKCYNKFQYVEQHNKWTAQNTTLIVPVTPYTEQPYVCCPLFWIKDGYFNSPIKRLASFPSIVDRSVPLSHFMEQGYYYDKCKHILVCHQCQQTWDFDTKKEEPKHYLDCEYTKSVTFRRSLLSNENRSVETEVQLMNDKYTSIDWQNIWRNTDCRKLETNCNNLAENGILRSAKLDDCSQRRFDRSRDFATLSIKTGLHVHDCSSLPQTEKCSGLNPAHDYTAAVIKASTQDRQEIRNSFTGWSDGYELLCIRCKEKKRNIMFMNCHHWITCECCSMCVDYCPDCDSKISERRQDLENIPCYRCSSKSSKTLFVNCNHPIVCSACSECLDFCPLCNGKIKTRLRMITNNKILK